MASDALSGEEATKPRYSDALDMGRMCRVRRMKPGNWESVFEAFSQE